MSITLPIGTILNERYKIIGILGQGGMSNVYLVEDEKLQSRWALKEMIDAFPDADKTEVVEQFHREARILAGLKHPNLPRVFDCFEEKNRHYLVMEYIEGLTLAEVFEKNSVISPQKAMDWAVQLCDVLASLHKAGIIYRDLKPGNIMVDSENRIYLIDFGIARLFSGGKIHDTIIIGTPGFASPEHHGRAETDARSDIFSLGATLHFLVTGVDPQIIPFVFRKPVEINPVVPVFFSEVIMKAVALDPAERFQSALEMKESIVSGSKTTAPGESPAATFTTTILAADSSQSVNQVFSTDFVKTEIPPIAISGGVITLGTLVLAGGAVTIPVLAGAAAVFLPVAFLTRKYLRKMLKTPGNIKISVSSDSVRFERGEIDKEVLWSEISGLMEFDEKTTAGIMVKKYKVFTEKGNFEYGDEVANVNQMNEIIVRMANLELKSDSEGYKRYGKG